MNESFLHNFSRTKLRVFHTKDDDASLRKVERLFRSSGSP